MPMRLHVIVALVSLLSFRTAWAQSQASRSESEPVRIVVDKVDTVHVKVHPLVTTKLIFESPIEDLHRASWEYFNFQREAGVLTMQPQTSLRDGQGGVWGKFAVETRASYLTVVVQATEDPIQATGGLRIVHRELAELEDAKGSNQTRQLKATLARLTALEGRLQSVTQQRDEAIKERDAYKAQLDISVRQGKEKDARHARDLETWRAKTADDERRWLEQEAGEYFDGIPAELYAVSRRGKQPANEAHAEILRALPAGAHLKARWRISNPEALPLHFVQIRQISPAHRTRVLDIGTPNVPDRSEGQVTTVAPGKAVEGVVIIPHVTMEELRSLALAFVTDSGRQLTATQFEFLPVSDEETEKRRRDQEAEGRVTIQVVGLAGAVWLANPQNEKELDAATLWSFGVRTGYGFNRFLSVEGELIGGWTENAHFDQGMQGELTRAAKLGRASAGLLVQLGYTVIPTLRIGVGGQAVSHDAQMESGMEIDTNFELDAVWYFSGGVNYRITKGLKIGAELGLISEASQLAGEGTRGTFHAGLHVAGSWQP